MSSKSLPPRVLYQTIDGKKCEPIERLVVDVPSESVGAVIEKLGARKGDLLEMTPVGSRMKLEFLIPARGLFGYRNEFLTDTRGEGIMASVFDSYAPYKGDLNRRNTGSLVAFETGESVSYGLFNAQDRGALFIGPGVKVYEGMVVGVSPKQEDITVNVCKKKQMTNMRAAGSDDALRLVPPRRLSLEQCLEFLADDELLEVTPENLRIRKTILNHEKRMKASHGGKKKVNSNKQRGPLALAACHLPLLRLHRCTPRQLHVISLQPDCALCWWPWRCSCPAAKRSTPFWRRSRRRCRRSGVGSSGRWPVCCSVP